MVSKINTLIVLIYFRNEKHASLQSQLQHPALSLYYLSRMELSILCMPGDTIKITGAAYNSRAAAGVHHRIFLSHLLALRKVISSENKHSVTGKVHFLIPWSPPSCLSRKLLGSDCHSGWALQPQGTPQKVKALTLAPQSEGIERKKTHLLITSLITLE